MDWPKLVIVTIKECGATRQHELLNHIGYNTNCALKKCGGYVSYHQSQVSLLVSNVPITELS